MAKRKKANRLNEHTCLVCENKFTAVRDDARYCSAKCRQTISRAVRAVPPGQKNPLLEAARKIGYEQERKLHLANSKKPTKSTKPKQLGAGARKAVKK